MVLLNKLSFKKNSFSKETVVVQFPAKTNTGWPKAPRDFPPIPAISRPYQTYFPQT